MGRIGTWLLSKLFVQHDSTSVPDTTVASQARASRVYHPIP
jgi:hypothetical protein